MTNDNADQPAYEGPLSPPYVLLLKIAIGVMSFMIVAGLVAMGMRVIYLASAPARQAAPTASAASARIAPAIGLALPPAATVRNLSLSGDRLAVHYESPKGAGFVILDTVTGKVLSRIAVVPETVN